MDTSPHNMRTLFAQLGLPDDDTSIDRFIGEHRPLESSTHLSEASFWNDSQKSFIRQEWERDSDWCETIDELNTRLRD